MRINALLGKWFSPSESSDGDHSFHDPRSSMSESQDGTDAFPKVLSQQPTSYKKGKSDRYL